LFLFLPQKYMFFLIQKIKPSKKINSYASKLSMKVLNVGRDWGQVVGGGNCLSGRDWRSLRCRGRVLKTVMGEIKDLFAAAGVLASSNFQTQPSCVFLLFFASSCVRKRPAVATI
jgi:hypothetical protein